MSLTPRTDYVAAALNRLPRQFRGKPRLAAILAAFAEATQELEAGLFTLYEPRFLANATGAVLDLYGALVGQARGGVDDTTYRLRIRARMTLNRSSGTAEELLAIARLLVAGSNTLTLREHFPAGVSLQVSGGVTALAPDVYAILYAAKAAGVAFRFTTQDGPDAERFTFQGGVGLGFAGYPVDWLGPRVDLVATGLGPAGLGPVDQVAFGLGPPTLGAMTATAPAGAAALPTRALTGAPVPPGLGIITIDMIDDVDFTWAATNGAGGDQNVGDGGGQGLPVVLVDNNMGLGSLGISITFGAGQLYTGANAYQFTVTDGVPSVTNPPEVSVVGVVPDAVGTVSVTVTSTAGNGTFTWESAGGFEGTSGQPMYVPNGSGGFLPVELTDSAGTGPMGFAILFGAGQPYRVGDTWEFEVIAAEQATSTPPTLAVTGPLHVTGRVTLRVTTGIGGYWFNYQRPDGSLSSAQSMARGTAVPLRNADLSLMGLSVTWPNVASIYTGARHAWRAQAAAVVVGGRLVSVR